MIYGIAWWRDLLVLLALAAALAEARGRRLAALALATAFAVLAVGFWGAALARPYGVLVDPGTTRWAADVSVAGNTGTDDRFLAGEPGGGAWVALARHLRPDLVLRIPTVLPVLVLPVGTFLIAALWGRREATLAAILWLGGATGALDVLRGVGFLPALWARPGPSLLWLATVAVVLAATRAGRRGGWSTALAGAGVVAWVFLGRRGPALGPVDALLALTFDQHVWIVLGAVGLRRGRDAASVALVTGGAILVLARALGGPGDAWAGAAFYRLGLVLAATEGLGTVAALIPAVATGDGREARWGVARERLPAALLLSVLLAGGFLTWWDPPRTDPVFRESLEPFPEGMREVTAWLRTRTPPSAVVLAHPDYAGAVAVLGGRRVLRAPDLLVAPDDERRLRLERAVLGGRIPAALVERYALRYVVLAPGEFREYGLDDPRDLEGRGAFRLAYASRSGIHVYELPPAAGPPSAFK